MNDRYTQQILDRANKLDRGEAALRLLQGQDHIAWLRTAVAAALAALMSLYPTVSVAITML